MGKRKEDEVKRRMKVSLPLVRDNCNLPLVFQEFISMFSQTCLTIASKNEYFNAFSKSKNCLYAFVVAQQSQLRCLFCLPRQPNVLQAFLPPLSIVSIERIPSYR